MRGLSGLLLVACVGGKTGSETGSETGSAPAPDTSETGAGAPTQEEVQAAIDAANYCETADDCVNIGMVCPFGCWILVNVDEAAAVQATIDAWRDGAATSCTFSCANMGEITCTNGHCDAASTY